MKQNSSKTMLAKALLNGEKIVPTVELHTCTLYECEKCSEYYRSYHGGVCPECKGTLGAVPAPDSYYNVARP